MDLSAAAERIEPVPIPRPDVLRVTPFWEAANAGRVELPCCEACGQFNWYPTPACGLCGGHRFIWTQVNARPEVFSWTVVRRALEPRLAPLVPFASMIVEFADAPGVRLVTRLVDASFDDLQIGRLGRMVFLDLGHPAVATGVIAPLFTLDPVPA